jgi:hypothetical protein
MIDHAALEVGVRDAKKALDDGADGHLLLARRRAIWLALGGRDEEGRCARARLSIAAARRVLPIWERLWPFNRLPHDLLDLTDQVCRGDVDPHSLTALRDRAETELDDISWGSSTKSAVGAGYAALRALDVARGDEPCDLPRPDSAVRDEDLQPRQRDSAYLAAAAAAGGAPWEPRSSADRRRDYWNWWLAEAVPSVARHH